MKICMFCISVIRMRKRMYTRCTEKLVHKYNCAKNILSLDYPVLAANVQFYLYSKYKTTPVTESSKYLLIYHNIGLVLQNKSIVRENTSVFPVIFKILFTKIMLHCSPWYTFFHRANLGITLKVISFCRKNTFLFQLSSCWVLLLVATFVVKSEFRFSWSTKANEVVFR